MNPGVAHMAQPPKRMLIVSLLITLAIYGFEGFRAFTAGSNSEAGLLAALFCLALVGLAVASRRK